MRSWGDQIASPIAVQIAIGIAVAVRTWQMLGCLFQLEGPGLGLQPSFLTLFALGPPVADFGVSEELRSDHDDAIAPAKPIGSMHVDVGVYGSGSMHH